MRLHRRAGGNSAAERGAGAPARIFEIAEAGNIVPTHRSFTQLHQFSNPAVPYQPKPPARSQLCAAEKRRGDGRAVGELRIAAEFYFGTRGGRGTS